MSREVQVRFCERRGVRFPPPTLPFDSVGSFTMLHHVATLALQNKILAEAFRVLRPGGVLIGSDSLASNDLHHFHAGDTYNPIEAASVGLYVSPAWKWCRSLLARLSEPMSTPPGLSTRNASARILFCRASVATW